MRILGIDPGSKTFHWAIWDDRAECFRQYGSATREHCKEVSDLAWRDDVHVVVEDMVGIYGKSKDRADTCKMIGWICGRFPRVLLIPRETIRAGLAGRANADKSVMHLAMSRLAPSFPAKGTRGVLVHHRDAMCVAYFGAGRVKQEALAIG